MPALGQVSTARSGPCSPLALHLSHSHSISNSRSLSPAPLLSVSLSFTAFASSSASQPRPRRSSSSRRHRPGGPRASVKAFATAWGGAEVAAACPRAASFPSKKRQMQCNLPWCRHACNILKFGKDEDKLRNSPATAARPASIKRWGRVGS